MPSLDPTLRSALEKAIIDARAKAEEGARAALDVLAVNDSRAFATFTAEQRSLRNVLRAKARQLGSDSQSTGFSLLLEEVAYVQWHRMLFARFLAENNLLMHPTGVAVTLEDCEELAAEEGDQDRWVTAARYAGNMLPGMFSPNDPSSQVKFAPESQAALEALLSTIPVPVFTSDDGLGWVYQFWQSKKKEEVSGRGKRIEKLDLAAYSQLFTEDYMVRFLLENSLGAWWVSRNTSSPLAKEFQYLKLDDNGAPLAGTFPGWPEKARDVTIMDPCCGSGHFLVVAFDMLRRMRMEEEDIGIVDAADAVVRDNLFGLELDPRCVQIAAFAVALVSWKVGGYHELPLPNVACSGIPVTGQLSEWTKLAGTDVNMQHTLERLYELFVEAPYLGSLVNPKDVPPGENMFVPEFGKVGPLLVGAMANEKTLDPVATVFGDAAVATDRGSQLLARQYTLVATNVPYLVQNKQGTKLKSFLNERYRDSKTNLATAFLERCKSLTHTACSYALVAPQNWLFLSRYEALRRRLLREQSWHIVALLGPNAFETISGEVVNVALQVFVNSPPETSQRIASLDASTGLDAEMKSKILRCEKFILTSQKRQTNHPDARFVIGELDSESLLRNQAISPRGIVSGDSPFWIKCFWELPAMAGPWRPLQSTVKETKLYGGKEHAINWGSEGSGMLRPGTRNPAYGRHGVAISLMGDLHATLYTGELYDNNTGVIVPNDPSLVPAIWAFCSSPEFRASVRKIDRVMKVTNATLLKIGFDTLRWNSIAKDMGKLPQPESDDCTQWLFDGNPARATESLQVAVARLLGYKWPGQEDDDLSLLSIETGILPLSPCSREEPATERLRSLLALAYKDTWSSEQQTHLLNLVGFTNKDLDSWLREGFFEQHCKLFHQLPFIWHIWDGRKDGFSALVNYHTLDAANLDRLIYTYLGEWIRAQRDAEQAQVPGATARLVAGLKLQKKLEAIRDGELPCDIYVRWKPLHEQPMGWHPDPNDGVRLNIRPFVKAGVLRSHVNVHWNKDRGWNPDGSERVNDVHFTLADKRASKEANTE